MSKNYIVNRYSELVSESIKNKKLHTAGSSGSADVAPRMIESGESGRFTPIFHCETAQTKNNPANCFCAQSNETQKAKRQCGRIDVGIGATWQSGEIASHSFAMTEYGRSMVEMLGVLAVMGVLSVAGIAGYNSAMNRHRANELLYEASKRATVVATGALTGQQNVSLGEFSGHSQVAGATFADDEAVDISGNTFAIKIKEVDEAVCTQMKNTIGSNTVVRDIPENCGAETISLVFNKDLSKSALASENLIDTSIDNQEDCQEAGKTWCYASTDSLSNGVCSNVTDCCKTITLNSCQTCQSVQGQYVVDYKLTATGCNFQGTNDGQCLPYAPTGSTGCGATNIQNMCLDNMQYAPSETEKSCLPVPCSMTGTCCQAAGEDGLYDVYGEGGLQNLMGQLQTVLSKNDFSAGVALIDQINVAQCTSCNDTDGALTNFPDDTPCYYLEGETLLQNYSNMNDFTDVTLPGTCKNGKCSKADGFCDWFSDWSDDGRPLKCNKYYSCDEPNDIYISDSSRFCQEPCPNRKLFGFDRDGGAICGLKCPTASFRVKDSWNSCAECWEAQSEVPVDPNECTSKCPNRKMEDGRCVLVTCPTGYFRGAYTCIPCDYQEDTINNFEIRSSTESKADCDKCANDGAHARTFVDDDNHARGMCRY